MKWTLPLAWSTLLTTLAMLTITGCQKNATTPSAPNAKSGEVMQPPTSTSYLVDDDSKVLIKSCPLPQYYWSQVLKTNVADKSIITLLHFKKTKDAALESSLLKCNQKQLSTLSVGNTSNQIIDFTQLTDHSLVQLRAKASGAPSLVQLFIENLTTHEDFAFTDPSQNTAVFYDSSFNATAVTHYDETLTLFKVRNFNYQFAKFSNVSFRSNHEAILSFVGQSGYRAAFINVADQKVEQVVELMPNSAFNATIDDSLDRTAAPVIVKGNMLYSALSASLNDAIIYAKRFEVTRPDNASNLMKEIILGVNLQTNERLSMAVDITPGALADQEQTPVDLVVDNNYLAVLSNIVDRNEIHYYVNRSVTLNLFRLTDLSLSSKKIYPRGNDGTFMAYGTTLIECRNTWWIGGSSDFKISPVGNITKHGDAFVTGFTLPLAVVREFKFGTKRNDAVTSMQCNNMNVLVGGLEEGPVSVTTPHQWFQNSFVGFLKF